MILPLSIPPERKALTKKMLAFGASGYQGCKDGKQTLQDSRILERLLLRLICPYIFQIGRTRDEPGRRLS